MEMWELIFSIPGMTGRLLNEVCLVLHTQTMRACFGMTEDYEILQLGLMQTLSPEDPIPAVLQDVECLKRCIRTTNFHLLWIALKGLAALLERPNMVSTPPALPHTPCPSLPHPRRPPHAPGSLLSLQGLTGIILLPHVLATLRFGKPHITAAALAVCCRVLRALRKKSASITSLRLVDLLTPYLDNVRGWGARGSRGTHPVPRPRGRGSLSLRPPLPVPGGRHGAGERHEALQRVHGARAVEAPQGNVAESAQRPAEPLPPHERGQPERGQGEWRPWRGARGGAGGRRRGAGANSLPPLPRRLPRKP